LVWLSTEREPEKKIENHHTRRPFHIYISMKQIQDTHRIFTTTINSREGEDRHLKHLYMTRRHLKRL